MAGRSLLLAILGVTLLTGCVDAEETWTFDEFGGGTYELAVRWNADLWRRVDDVLSDRAMARFAARPFPLRKAQWADGLKDLKDVEVLLLEEGTHESGKREIRAKLKFKRLADVLRWEVLARRTVRAGQAEKDGKKIALCNFYMEPIARVPVLDTLAALLEAVDKPPPKAEGAAAARDGGPLDRFGLDEEAARLVWKMVKLPLAEARIKSTVEAPARIERTQGRTALENARRLSRSWGFDDLRKVETDRTVRLAWRLRSLDKPVVADQTGDADPRPRGPTGEKR